MKNVKSKRILFKKGNQKKLLDYLNQQTGASWSELAIRLNLNQSTLEKSYRNEVCTIPLDLLAKICKLIKLTDDFILNKYNGKIVISKTIGRKCFGESHTNLSPTNTNYRKRKIKLDILKINYSSKDKEKGIILPKYLTLELAEEIGIHYGDGFLSNKKYEYRLKGNKKDEKEYYDNHIAKLYKQLFNLNLSIKEFETTYGFELSSKAIWQFKNKVLRIQAGKKNDIDFPKIINFNNKAILILFIRGIFDTDGSVSFQNKYNLGNYYPLISLSLKSKKLIDGIYKSLLVLGFKPCINFDARTYWCIQLYGYENLIKYSKIIGWHNPKHLNKVKKWKIKYPQLSMAVLV